MRKFENISKKIVEILTGFLFLDLAATAAFMSVVRADGYAESYEFNLDNPVLNVLGAVIFMALFFLICKWVSKNLEKRRRILLIAEMCFAVIFGLGFSAVSKCFPTADQASVYYGAKHFAADWFGDLAEKGSYFSVYPHQMALAFAEELVLRLFHTESYHVLQGVNALCNALTIYSLYSIGDIMFEDKKVSVYTLLTILLCMPLYIYTPFVYGDLASIAFSLLGVLLLLRALLKNYEKKWVKWAMYAGSVLSLLIATLVRSNTLIFVIAVILCTLVYLFVNRKPKLLIYIAVVAILCGSVNTAAIKLYEMRSGTNINDGMPSICHMVMGLQEGPMGNGYYNGYNFDTYVNRADYDQKLAKELAMADLEARIEEFKASPSYAFKFFGDKFVGQWESLDFDCYHFTCGAYYERWGIVESLYSGGLYKVTSRFMDRFGFFVYTFTCMGIGYILFRKPKYELSIIHYLCRC